MVYDRTANIKATYEDFRTHHLLGSFGLAFGLDLGWGVLDANVEVVAGVLAAGSDVLTMFDARDCPPEQKAVSIKSTIAEIALGQSSPSVFRRSLRGLARLPNAVVSPEFPEYLVDALAFCQTLSEAGFPAYSGYTLKADQHYRLWWEVPAKSHNTFCVPMFNGAGYEPYTTAFSEAAVSHVAPDSLPSSTTTRILNQQIMGLPGLCFGKRGEFLAVQFVPAGLVFTQEGRPLPVSDQRQAILLAGYLNTPLLRSALNLYCGQHKTSGYVNKLPYFMPPESDKLALLTEDAALARLSVETMVETSRRFLALSLGGSLHEAWLTARRKYEIAIELTKSSEIAWENALELHFQVPTNQRKLLREFATRQPTHMLTAPWRSEDAIGYAECVLSFMVSLAVGRFDIRLATGARAMPTVPGPFDPLPNYSPALLVGNDGLLLESAPRDYPLTFPDDGILVDDPGSSRDIVVAVREVFDKVLLARADEWWQEASTLLDPKGGDLRAWLSARFFDYHLKQYSRRRKAPVLWQLATVSGRFNLWLYAHKVTRDTFFKIQNEVLVPTLAHEKNQLETFLQSSGGSASSIERKRIVEQESFVEELGTMLDEVKRVAPLWKPTLDDGVLLTMAPLWRLVPHHKSWQKDLKAAWDALCGGEYDWTHIAMHLWPERVIPKCSTDRSLAIVHGVEEVFWVEGSDRKWKARVTPIKPVEVLVRERSSPSVKASLKSLLDAPSASGSGRGRGGRAAASAVVD